MKEKDHIIESSTYRTKNFGVDVILIFGTWKPGKTYAFVTNQLVRSSATTSSNYRTACKGRLQAESFTKIRKVVEKAGKSQFGPEIIHEARLTGDTEELSRLLTECSQLVKKVTRSRDITNKKIIMNAFSHLSNKTLL